MSGRGARPVAPSGPRPPGPDGGPGSRPTLARSTAVMAVGTMLSRATGFGRLAALAYAMGFTRLTDSYNLANVTPNIVYELVLGGVLSATLVPVFVDRLAADDDDGRAAAAVLTMAGVVALGAVALFVLAAPAVVHIYTIGNDTSSAGDQRAVATTLLRLFAPQVACYAFVTVAAAVLQARRRFAAPMFAPVLNNLVVIGVLLALPRLTGDLRLASVRHDTGALLLLGLGTTAGVAAMALALVPSLRGTGVSLRPVWAPRHPAVRDVVRLSGWTLGFVAANQGALLVTLVLAGGRAGDVAAYNAAQVFFLLPHGIFAVSVITALQPDLAEHWSRRDVVAFGRRVAVGLRTIAVVALPAAVGYLCLARPIVRTALEHGALASASAATAADVLALLAVGLPGFSLYLFLVRAFQAMRDTRSVFFLYLVENGLNVVLAVCLYPVLGVQGLALSYALAYTGGTAAALVHLRRRVGPMELASVVQVWARTGLASAVMAGAVLAVAAVVGPAPLRAVAGMVAGVTVYLLAARRLGIQELSVLRNRRRVP